MNISYNWLKDLISINLSAGDVAEKLTRVGMAVEGVHPHGGDFVLDIDVTSNRPDCLSHLGIARELGVITGSDLPVNPQSRKEEKEDPFDAVPFPSVLAPEVVRIEDADLCHRFTARIIRNVKIGPSPDWLVERLEAIGERSINNVADITNYVMHELGQPMHSFDLDKLAEKRIVVRRAKAGETIKTLDEVERKLEESMLAICDAEKPVAVAGVIGGFDSSITDQTTNVLLEVAYFKRGNIRQTSRKLALATEASYRFERGVDIENLKRASDRAAEFICELARGEGGEFVDVYPTKFSPNVVESNDISAAVKRLTGLDVDTVECVCILNALGIKTEAQISNVKSLSDLTQTPEILDLRSDFFVSPSWRHDIAIEEDLVEEIARHAGYENIAGELPPAYGAGVYQKSEFQKKKLRQTLIDGGFDEAITYSFIDTRHDGVFEEIPGLIDTGTEEKFVTLQDSVIEGAVRMRPTLLPGLLDSVRLNFNQQRRDQKLFEIGKAFAAKKSKDNLPVERELFAFAITGGEINENRAMAVRQLDFYDAKGAVESALEAVGFSHPMFEPSNIKHLRSGQTATISVNDTQIGYIGRLNEEIAANYKFRQPVYVAEIDLQTVLAQAAEPIIYAALPKYPSIVRDISLLVDRDTTYDDVRKAVLKSRADLFQTIEFVDIYEGKGLAENERSLTVRLEYRSSERTLVDDEVAAVHDALIRNLESGLGVRQRL